MSHAIFTYNLLAMKTKNLLPNCWKPIGWILLVLGVSVIMWETIKEENPLLRNEVTIPWPFGGKTSENSIVPDLIQHNPNGTITLDLQSLIDELCYLMIISGLFIAGFARVKQEDERTAQMRLEALQWAIYGNTLVLALCIAFVYGMDFLLVMLYNMFTPLLIFVLRFHWLLVKETRELKEKEGKTVTI